MTSYELVRRAVEFDKPERVPLRFPNLNFNDTHYWPIDNPGVGEWKPGQKYRRDEWGCVWERPREESGIKNMGQIKAHPLEDLEKINDYAFPDPDDLRRYEDIEKTLSLAQDKYIIVGTCHLLEAAWFMHGMSNLFIDLYDKPELVHKLLENITDFALGVINNLKKFQGSIHGFQLGDDWGSQNGCYLSIPVFREFFKPHYKKIIDQAHRVGMHVWLHCCGKVNEVIEEFVDVGLDVINLQQPLVLGIDEISRRYAGRICFENPVDIQKTLPAGTPEEIDRQAKTLIKKWGTAKGGFIGSDYGDNPAIGVSEKNVRIMFEAFRKYGKYKVCLTCPNKLYHSRVEI